MMQPRNAAGSRDHQPWHLRLLISRHLSPERIFILSFAGIILLGGLVLWLPFSATAKPLSAVDALFTSASAVCVTGLAPIDLGQDLSTAGQVITIVLFQVGGLGILTFSAVFFVILGRGLASKERDIMQSAFLYAPRRDLASILKFVFLSTFLYEGAGTLLLWLRLAQDFPPGQALFHAVYLAISAFNNCGFTLFSDSLVAYQGDPIVNLTIAALIVAGGIGFIVHYELHTRFFGQQRRLSVHTKVVLVATTVLIIGGAVLFFVFEHNRILKDLPWPNQVLASLFQSITPRTAGSENTVDIGMLANETILLMITLMFIGASPGSTGGRQDHQREPALPDHVEPSQRRRRGEHFQPHHPPGTPAAHDLHHSGGLAFCLLHHVGPAAGGRSQRGFGREPPSFRGVYF